jgi:tetratricopeptide (TPR) repeat protein
MLGYLTSVRSFLSFLILFIIVLCFSTLTQPAFSQDREVQLDNIYQKILNSHFEESIKALDEMLLNDSTYYPASYLRGMSHYFLGDHKEALNDFQRVLRQKGNYQHVYYFIGMLYSYMPDYNMAIYHMSKEIDAFPHSAEPYFIRGTLYVKGYTYNKVMQSYALTDLNKAVSLDSSKSSYYYELGLCEKFSFKRKEAIKSFNRAIKLDPSIFAYYDERNTCHELLSSSLIIRKTDLYEGVKNLKKYDDQHEPGMRYYYVGRCFKLMYDFSKSKTELDSSIFYFNRALIIDSTNALAYMEKGRIYHMLKQEGKASIEYRNAVRNDPKNSEMWLNYAWTLENLGNKKEAHKAFAEANKLYPEDFRAIDGLERTK